MTAEQPPQALLTLQEQIVLKIQSANIQEDDWAWNIIQQIWQPYTKGYFDAYLNCLNNLEMNSHVEEYREKLLEICRHKIWG